MLSTNPWPEVAGVVLSSSVNADAIDLKKHLPQIQYHKL